jgi:predicted site-specific integrase-resolvase
MGTIIVTQGETTPASGAEQAAISARVSSPEHRDQLERQAARLYGQRRAKRTTERIAAALRGEEVEDDATR